MEDNIEKLIEADDSKGLEALAAELREKLAKSDAKYVALRERRNELAKLSPEKVSPADLAAAEMPEDECAEASYNRARLGAVQAAFTAIKRQHSTYGACPADWPEEGDEPGGDA